MTHHIFETSIAEDGTLTVYVSGTMGITNVDPALATEVVRGRDCERFDRCPTRKGDGSCFCWQGRGADDAD